MPSTLTSKNPGRPTNPLHNPAEEVFNSRLNIIFNNTLNSSIPSFRNASLLSTLRHLISPFPPLIRPRCLIQDCALSPERPYPCILKKVLLHLLFFFGFPSRERPSLALAKSSYGTSQKGVARSCQTAIGQSVLRYYQQNLHSNGKAINSF